MAAGETFPLGPGTLTIGATGTEIDISCLINNAVLAADKEQGDAETKLCGTVVPGSVTYTWTLSGNVDLDIADAAGLWNLSNTAAGTQQDFTFEPNTDAGTSAAGTLVIDPLPLGGDETGTTMAADFEWAVVGKPTYTVGGVALDTSAMAVRAPAMAGSSASSGSDE
jgi:hypothetical protein